MYRLLIASLLWAPSFGLIKVMLPGVDAGFVTFARLALSCLLFAPFLRPLPFLEAAGLAVLGAVQYGLMYVFYLLSFEYLASHEVALFTVMTPVYVTLINDVLARRFRLPWLLAAALAVAGAALIVFKGSRPAPAILHGCLLVQASNLCFAFGQVRYARWAERRGRVRDREVFGWLYLGGCLTGALLLARLPGGVPRLGAAQWATLAYLGLVPSGLAFFLWNSGARRVSAGTLAAMNNAKIPLAVLTSLAFFGDRPALLPLAAGAVAIAGAALAGSKAGAGKGDATRIGRPGRV